MTSHDVNVKSQETASAGDADLMKAVIAASAIVAFADGGLDNNERNRIFALFEANPSLAIFSRSHVEAVLSLHEAAFKADHVMARRKAYVTIESLRLTDAAAQLILDACRQVLEADGVVQTAELAEMEEIRSILQRARS